MLRKTIPVRVLTAREVKEAVSDYIYRKYGENAKSWKFTPSHMEWIFKHHGRFPYPDMKLLELNVDKAKTLDGQDIKEVFGVDDDEE